MGNDRDAAIAARLREAYEADLFATPDDVAHRWCDEDSGGNHRFDADSWFADLAAALTPPSPAANEVEAPDPLTYSEEYRRGWYAARREAQP